MYQLSVLIAILSGIDHTPQAIQSLETDLRTYTSFMKRIPSSEVVEVEETVLAFVLQSHCDDASSLLNTCLQEAYVPKKTAVA